MYIQRTNGAKWRREQSLPRFEKTKACFLIADTSRFSATSETKVCFRIDGTSRLARSEKTRLFVYVLPYLLLPRSRLRITDILAGWETPPSVRQLWHLVYLSVTKGTERTCKWWKYIVTYSSQALKVQRSGFIMFSIVYHQLFCETRHKVVLIAIIALQYLFTLARTLTLLRKTFYITLLHHSRRFVSCRSSNVTLWHPKRPYVPLSHIIICPT